MPEPSEMIDVALFFGCCLWVLQILRRAPLDLQELRNSQDSMAKLAILSLWLLTLLAARFIVNFGLGVVAHLS